MKFLLKLLFNAMVVVLLSYMLPFVKISDPWSIFFFVLLIALLNVSLKPLLIIFTIPITLITLGLFLIIINGIIILVADYFINGIYIGHGLWGAVIFSILLSIGNYLIGIIIND
jgi:putative membrane protein